MNRTFRAPIYFGLGPVHQPPDWRKVLAQDKQAGDAEHPALDERNQPADQAQNHQQDSQSYSKSLSQGGQVIILPSGP